MAQHKNDRTEGQSLEDFAARKQESQFKTLARIGDEVTFLRTASDELYARVPVEGLGGIFYELCTINEHGSGFRHWLTMSYYDELGGVPSTTAMTQAMSFFTAKAHREGCTAEVFTRIAHADNTLYLDLGTPDWKAVKITSTGWKVVSDYPVYFRRPNGLKPLPVPQRGGSLETIRDIVSLATNDDYKLAVAWLLCVLHPHGPYPILAISGEHGTAKTSASKYLRNLIDPNEAPLRNPPKDAKDLVIAAKNSRIIALDNLSSIPPWLADAMCRLATEGGAGGRALYTNDQEWIINACRPILFNGIEEMTARGDLVDRSIAVRLQPVTERKSKAEVQALFDREHPRILGALLDAVSSAMAEQSNVKIAKLPRMADFAIWVTAAEKQLGWRRGSFMAVYNNNRESLACYEVADSPVASAIVTLMENQSKWHGMADDLHSELVRIKGNKAHLLPKAANSLSGKLTRLTPALRVSGIHIFSERTKRGRYYEITKEDASECDAKGDDLVTMGDDLSPSGDDLYSGIVTPLTPKTAKKSPEGDDGDDKIPCFSISDLEEKEEEVIVEKSGKRSSPPSLWDEVA